MPPSSLSSGGGLNQIDHSEVKWARGRETHMKQIIRYGHGNCLSYAEYGDKNGFPLLVQHGLIASIDESALFDRLVRTHTRLICIARPGYGESSPYALTNIAEWGAIVSILSDELKFAQFDVLGMSSGAPYSYAIGYHSPHKVRNIYIFSGIPALYDEEVLSVWPYPVDKSAGIAELKTLAHELFFSHLTKEDLATRDVRDSMMNDGFGVALDLQLRCKDWGFKLSDVKANVFMRHSKWDPSIPFITAEMTSKMLPRCRLEVKNEDVHFSRETLDDFFKTTLTDTAPPPR